MKWDIKVLSMKCFYSYLACCRSKRCICYSSKIGCLAARLLTKAGSVGTRAGGRATNTGPPENGDVVAYSLHVEWTFDEHVSDALGSQTHEVPPLQIGFNVVQPLCGNGFVIPTGEHMEQDPSSLHTYPESQVPCVLPLPCAPSTAHLQYSIN